MCVGTSKSPAESRSDPVRMIEVGPCPADHLPAKLAQNVLTQLFLIDHIAAVARGIQLPTVLDLAVELPDRPTLLPGKVDPGGESTIVIEDLKLQLWRRDARFEKASSAPRLPGTLAATIDESRNTARGESPPASGASAQGSPRAPSGPVQRATPSRPQPAPLQTARRAPDPQPYGQCSSPEPRQPRRSPKAREARREGSRGAGFFHPEPRGELAERDRAWLHRALNHEEPLPMRG